MPFDWTVNPYRGCAMGCRYCYATYTHEFMGIDDAGVLPLPRLREDGRARRRPRAGSPSSCERASASRSAPPPIPTSPAKAQARVTRGFLELVAQHRNVRLGIITKGALILRDLDLLQRIHRALAPQRPRLAHLAARRAGATARARGRPRPTVRIEVMRRLVEAGIDGLAGPRPRPARRSPTTRPASTCCWDAWPRAGVRHMFSNVLFLRSPDQGEVPRAGWPPSSPRYLEAYQRAYAQRVYLGGPLSRHDRRDACARCARSTASWTRSGTATSRSRSRSRWTLISGGALARDPTDWDARVRPPETPRRSPPLRDAELTGRLVLGLARSTREVS